MAGMAVQPYTPGMRAEGQLHLKMTYKPFEDDETDTGGYREAEAYALMLQEQAITDIKSAAGAFTTRRLPEEVLSRHINFKRTEIVLMASKVTLSRY